MHLSALDIGIVLFFFLLILLTGLSYTRKAGKDLKSFFLAGRNLPWYIAGISMVATTFAADTPLAVNELVYSSGISGNWLWWSFLAGGMLTTFFFANLWRKADVLTEVELIELRYSGKPAAFLRGFKAVYLGLFLNVIIIGWVNAALISLLQVFFGLSPQAAFWYTAAAMAFVAVYASLAGLLGVVMTDVIQFVIAMTGCIILAVLVVGSEQVGGIVSMKAQLTEMDPAILHFLPKIGEGHSTGVTLSLSLAAFLTYATVQWWASWYPGAEPGGGGYVAQRMMSARTEKDAVYATLFFQIAHYCIRPWPWILVGLCTLILYPGLEGESTRLGYVYAMRDFLPSGLKGLLLVAFFAAYMSTISTQLNWGSSYLVNDLYRRFLRRSDAKENDRRDIIVSRITTVLVMLTALFATRLIHQISGAWAFLMQCGAGLGLVLILRWYWWRINAWSEIAATIAPFLVIGAVEVMKAGDSIGWWTLSESANHFINTFPNIFLLTVGFTTVTWLLVMYLTPPTSEEKLRTFYRKVRPGGRWGAFSDNGTKRGIGWLTASWILAIVFTYGFLFLIGRLVLMEWESALWTGLVVLVSFVALTRTIRKSTIFDADLRS